jgi:hypothetical protein
MRTIFRPENLAVDRRIGEYEVRPINIKTNIFKNVFSEFVTIEYGHLRSNLLQHVHTAAYMFSTIESMPGSHFLKSHSERSPYYF